MSNLKRIALVHLALLIVLTISACGSDSPTDKIDVGGYQLAYQCFGEGTPTVIVEAGLGEGPTVNLNWMTVIEGIQTITHICIYDRAGIGQSDSAPTPRTSMDIAQDLHVLLETIPLPGPYILVAHSIGGYHARVFYHQYPQDVAGIILVDSSHPDIFEEYAQVYPTPAPTEEPDIATKRPLFMNAPPPSDNPEGLDLVVSAEQVRNAGSLGSTPLIVLSQSDNPNIWDIAGFSAEDKQRMLDLRKRLQADLVTLSSDSTHITAQVAGHYIHIDEPQLVIDAITQMVRKIQNH